MTAFQMVHFRVAYHSSWWSYINQPDTKWEADGDPTSTGRNSRLRTLWDCLVWQCMGKTPHNIDYNQSVKAVVLGSVV